MTATAVRPVAPSRTWTIGEPRLLAGLDRHPHLDAATHLATHGPLPGTDRERLLALLDSVRLCGRGGAGFPLAAKIRALRGARPTVIVNGSESEPASYKDRTLLQRSPHLVLDGALALAGAVGATEVIVAVSDGFAAGAVEHAMAHRPDARRVRVQRTAGGFVAGEARALVRALAGGPPLPPGRREPPTQRGKLVSNPETVAQLAILLRRGARGYADTGTLDEPGTALLTVGGAVGSPGVVELPLGTPLSIVLRAAQAEPLGYVVTGGYHGTWLPVSANVVLSRAGLAAVGATLGATLGAGVLLAIGSSTCALGELARVAAWLAAQSSGQCGPCRFGLPALAADVVAAAHGHPAALANASRHAAAVMGRGACAHPDGAVRFVRSGLSVLGDELAAHAAGGCGRPVRGVLPLGREGAR